ncbi:MAG: hypothetical protein U0441_25975 [Polyangiaceae bacterium]
MKRIRGLKSLVIAAVDHGSQAIEKVQLEVAKTPFDLLEQVPNLKLPVAGARLVYNTSVASTHLIIRTVNKVVGDTLDVVLDQVSKDDAPAAKAEEKAPEPKKAEEKAPEPTKEEKPA